MPRKKVLVVGLGEVGRPIFDLIKESGKFDVYGVDVDEKKMAVLEQKMSTIPTKAEVMHVCIPCTHKDRFTETISDYMARFKPELTIINSTVPPGTTSAVYQRCKRSVAHSPIRGVHTSLEHMKWEIKRWKKYVGGVDVKSGSAAQRHFEQIGLSTKVLKSSLDTELAKLFETTYRAWMIVCFQEMHRISRSFDADFDGIVDFLQDTHRVRLDRPIMYPGVIGGHCVIPNTQLLLENCESEFLRLILKSNEKRKQEVKDEIVAEDVEKVQRRVKAMSKELRDHQISR